MREDATSAQLSSDSKTMWGSRVRCSVKSARNVEIDDLAAQRSSVMPAINVARQVNCRKRAHCIWPRGVPRS
jgi:hypothetical protein